MLQRVAAELRTRQVNVKDDWLQLCMEHIRTEEGIGNDGNPRQLADAVFKHFLMADLNAIASQGTLPNVEKMHKDHIAGSHLLQIDEMVNIEAPIEHVGRVADQDEDEEKALEKKQRHEADGARGGGRGGGSRGGRGGFAQQNQRPGQGAGTTNSNYRTFKLSLTDGVRRVFALEYRRVPVLDLERTPPGTKILVRDVLVRRGMLLLLPQNVQVLGGRVASLVDAHLQTIEYKRKRGQGIVEEPPTVNATGAQQQDGDWRSSAAKRPRMEGNETGTTATTATFHSSDTTAKAATSRPAASTSSSATPNNSTTPKLRSSYSASSLLSSSSSSSSTSSTTSTSSSLASSAATFAGAFASSLIPTARQSVAPVAQAQSSTSTSTSFTSSSSSSSTSVVSIPFFSRSSTTAPSSSSSRSSATTLSSSATSRVAPLTPPGINDSNDSIEDDEEEETKPTSAANLLLRAKQEIVGSAEGQQPSSKPRGNLSLSLKTKKKTIVKEEPAVEAVISLLDEELPSPIPVPRQVKEEPGQARPADDYLADVPDDFGFSLGDLAEFDEHPPTADARSPEPFVYIDELRPEDMATGRKVTLKAASIELLKGSFQYKTGKYSLELKLEDGSGTLQALMSDEVVAEMMGVTCTEFKANLTRGPEGINENKRRMRQLEVALFNLEGLMDLTLEDPKPLVVRVYRPTTDHVKQLLARVSTSSQLSSPTQLRRNPLTQ